MNWVSYMLEYTVAGGKMNRGLSLMSVQKHLFLSFGKEITNKVSDR